jgi:hypothetical protein
MDVRCSRDGKRFVTAGWDGTVFLWDATTRKALRTFSAPLTQFFCADFLDDKRIIAGSSNGVFVWNAASGATLAHISPGEYIPELVISQDRTQFVFTQYRQGMQFDAATLTPLGETKRHAQFVVAVAQTADGKLLATSAYDGTIWIHDAVTRERLYVLEAGTGAVYSLAFNKEGTQLASGHDDRVARIWDLNTRTIAHTLQRHEGLVFSVRFDAECKRLYTCSQDRSICVWDTADWRCVAVLNGHRETVSRIAVHPDGRTLLSASQDDTVRFWDLPVLEGSRNDFDEIAYATTGLRIEKNRFDARMDPAWPIGLENNRALMVARLRHANDVRRFRLEFEANFEGYRYIDKDGARQYFPPRKRLPSGQFEEGARGKVNFTAWWAEQHPDWTEGYQQAALVSEVQAGGQALERGLQTGDIIWSLNGERVNGRDDLRSKLEPLGEDAAFTLVIRRYERDTAGRLRAKRTENGHYILNARGETEWDVREFEVRMTTGRLGMRIDTAGVMARPFR